MTDAPQTTDVAVDPAEKAGELAGTALSVLLFVVMVVFAVGCGLLGWFQG